MMGIEVDISGAGGHVARIERKIQMIKERVRAHICGRLPFTLTLFGLSMLILYCVSRVNFQFSVSRPGGPSPRENFTGQRVDGTRDFRAAFGDYAVCTTPSTSNSMASRTEDCIVLLPTGNRTGSVKMLSLATGSVVTRDQFKILPMPASIINVLNGMAAAEGRKPSSKIDVFNAIQNMHSIDTSNMPTYILNNQEGSGDALQQGILPDPPGQDIIMQDPTELFHPQIGGVSAMADLNVNQPDIHSDFADHIIPGDGVHGIIPPEDGPEDGVNGILLSEDGVHDTPSADDLDQVLRSSVVEPTTPIVPLPPSTPEQPRRDVLDFSGGNEGALTVTASHQNTVKLSGSSVALIEKVLLERKRSNTVSNTSNVSVREALRTRGDDAKKVILKELKQMVDKKVWQPVHGSKLTAKENASVIRSSMFVKRKNYPDGSFEKYKARLVAGGDQQDKNLYDDLSSPTVSTSAVFTMLAVSAQEHRSCAVVDIGGAYLNAHMDIGVKVYMRLDRTITDFMLQLDPAYGRYTDDKGRVVVLLKKAVRHFTGA